MIEILNILKKEITFLILLKAFFIYSLTLFDVYNISLFPWDSSILGLLVMILIPLILFHITSKKKEVEISLKQFILIGLIISSLSSFIRVFVLNKYLLKLVYYNTSKNIIDTMSIFERTIEFTKFTLVGFFIFIIVGVIKYQKR